MKSNTHWLLFALFFLSACTSPNVPVTATAVPPAPTASPPPPTATLAPLATIPPTPTPPAIATVAATATIAPTIAVTAQTDGPPSLAYLAPALQTQLATFDGLSSVYVMDLQTGEELNLNGDVAIAGMSLLKIPILLETYRVLPNEPDVEQTRLISETAVLSGNYTANLLLETIAGRPDAFAGVDVVNDTLRRLGLFNTFIAIPYDEEARPNHMPTFMTPANQRQDVTTLPDTARQTTAHDLGQLLSMIYTCSRQASGPLLTLIPQPMTADDCTAVLAMMSHNHIHAFIESGVPAGTVVAHKHGWIGDTHGDAAVVFSPGGDYVLVVALYHHDWLEWEVSAPLIANLSQLVYAHFNDPAAYSAAVLAQPPAFAMPTVTPTVPPNLPIATIINTGGSGLALRATPGGAQMGILPEGLTVQVWDVAPIEANGRSWRKIHLLSGQDGWVGDTFLQSAP